MVTPLHLLLVASRKIDLLPSGIISVDNWVNLRMNPKDAAAIAVIRHSIEALIIRAARYINKDN